MTTAVSEVVPEEMKLAGAGHTFAALFLRDLRVLRRDLVGFVLRNVSQPVLFVFVFAYVLPKIAAAASGGAAPGGQGGTSFSTVLVPGMISSALMFQGILAVTTPLVMELSYTREIEDRALAPVPIWALGVEKILLGSFQAVLAAGIVLPCVLLIHAEGSAPTVDFSQWPLLILVVVLAAVLTSAVGLLLGTVVDPRKLSTLFGVIIVPMTMLGCVYYPWQQLSVVPWLQYAVLVNPLVYISEALRGALTPDMPHMATGTLLIVLLTAVMFTVSLSLRTFRRRLVG